MLPMLPSFDSSGAGGGESGGGGGNFAAESSFPAGSLPPSIRGARSAESVR